SPAGSEVCNGVDDDCNGTIDDGVTTTYYEDTDGDGFGSMDPAATTIDACFRPDGFQSTATDCH
ncbi:MAG: hypothetical protein GWN07_32990, partial [Actinobacteria bacterium]|nr:hypothetical protein [Actinomycetota bacterium]NIS35592.1 hypothetical protein [Actinomycetota bacterium]NIU70250.1 hypothetical protein [Actinomycetota bacterium]NIV58391.1 hypothetical protein [Actinomycetota bacterium]NIV89931.1 hypothetical protein [Actinomycetota bacterium]